MQTYREPTVEHHRPYPTMRPQMRPPPVMQQPVDPSRMGPVSMDSMMTTPPAPTGIPPCEFFFTSVLVDNVACLGRREDVSQSEWASESVTPLRGVYVCYYFDHLLHLLLPA